jgi:TonB family protein
MTIHDWLAEWSSWIWPLFVKHLWQATLFSALALVVTWLLKRGPARARHTVWLLALAKFALPSVLFVWLGHQIGLEFNRPTFSPTPSATPEIRFLPTVYRIVEPTWGLSEKPANSFKEPQKHSELYCALTLIWFLGCLFLLGTWVKRRRQFTEIIKAGYSAQTGREAEALQRVQDRRGRNRQPTLVISARVSEPGVWGVSKPVVVLPQGVADHLCDEELETLMLHELVHVDRRDNLTSTLQMALCSLLWFYPLVWFIDRKLLVERERACDEEVLRLTKKSKSYAASLLKVLRFCLSWKLAGVSSVTSSNLKRRVEYIMSDNTPRKLTPWHRLSMAMLAATLIISSVVAGLFRHESILAKSSEKRASTASRGSVEVQESLEAFPAGNAASTGFNGGSGSKANTGKAVTEPKIGSVKGKFLAAIISPSELREGANQTEPAPVPPQKGVGKLSGAVHDASGARVPDAMVTVSVFGGHSKEIVYTNNAGEYEFWSLPAGTYEVEVSKDGFRLFQRKDIVVHPNAQAQLDVSLEVGEVFQTVEVTAKPPQAAKATFMGVGPPRRIRVGGNVQQANLIAQTKPIYPEQAQQAGIEGTVLLEAIIGKDGSVINYRVVNTLAHPFLVKAAVEAVKQWLYKPTLLNGEPVEVVTTIAVSFRLSQTNESQ